MGKLNDLTGQRFGKWSVLTRSSENTKYGQARWECICDCGTRSTVDANMLRRGKSKSCGCSKVKHNQFGTRLYGIHSAMISRCYNKNLGYAYEHYGGRGIGVCDEWRQFKSFYKWSIENGYNDFLTIDRVDNNKGYSPDNCRWATAKEQQKNKRKNLIVIVDGSPLSLVEYAEFVGVKYATLFARYSRGKMPNVITVEDYMGEIKNA